MGVNPAENVTPGPTVAASFVWTSWSRSCTIPHYALVSLSNPPRYASNSALAERQVERFGLVRSLIQRDYPFKDKEEARQFFTKLSALFKNLNYSASNTEEYKSYRSQVDELVKTLGRTAAAPATEAVPESQVSTRASVA